MRIGIDIRALMEGRTTGVQVYITNLLRAIFEIDRDNKYILFANSSRDIRDVLPQFQYPNVELKLFRYSNKIFNIAQKFGFPKIDRLLGGVDIFFSPHWRAVALSKTAPLIVTFHDLSFEIVPSFFTLWRRVWHKFMDYERASKRANKIIAVSENTKQDLINLYNVPADKIRVIYSAVHPAQPADYNPKYFLFFSTFEPRKNLQTVLTAYEEYCETSKVKLPLVLAGSSGWKNSLKIPTHLQDNIKVLQNVSEEQKIRLYEQAEALLFLSFYEGFGFPVLEAASAGVPVIASAIPSLLEIASDFAIFVSPFRSSQVAAAMISLEEDQGYRDMMRARGLEAAKKYSWEKTAKATLELFKSVRV
ncbi:MAG: glycosyltransferase family 1 protein [Candidatus Doudnabacteria bacterium]|nr:glycosyltransferase family 1 protein [bacterium]MDZ4244217.1 glycosyltransferase family 1 protein [Candidatus Doudnabacteria bacterium]